jgi:hypothetical protein
MSVIFDPFDEPDRLHAMQEANTNRKQQINEWAEATNRDFDRLVDYLGDGGEGDAFADLLEAAWYAFDAEYLLITAVDIVLDEARRILDEDLAAHGLDRHELEDGGEPA